MCVYVCVYVRVRVIIKSNGRNIAAVTFSVVILLSIAWLLLSLCVVGFLLGIWASCFVFFNILRLSIR